MKTLKCDLCEHEEQAQTFEEWMEALKPHYMQAHADVMSDSSKGQDDMMRWVKENKARFDAAPPPHRPRNKPRKTQTRKGTECPEPHPGN